MYEGTTREGAIPGARPGARTCFPDSHGLWFLKCVDVLHGPRLRALR